jgi:hypothetical protein
MIAAGSYPGIRRPEHGRSGPRHRRQEPDATGIDGEARSLGGKPVRRLGKSKVVPRQVHEISGIFAIMDCERRVEPDLNGVLAQELRPNAVERASPSQGIGHNTGLFAQCLPRNPLNSLCHLGCRSPRKRHSRIRRGSAPLTMRWATRCARVLVLPEPAPARTKSGPPEAQFPSETPCSTARRCSALSVSRWDATGMIESFCVGSLTISDF